MLVERGVVQYGSNLKSNLFMRFYILLDLVIFANCHEISVQFYVENGKNASFCFGILRFLNETMHIYKF